jgi:hypothetical protein
MLQPRSSLPEVPLRPAPWSLRGSAWIVALKLSPDSSARDAFLPPDLVGQGRGLASYLMYVDYSESVAAYRVLSSLAHSVRGRPPSPSTASSSVGQRGEWPAQ